MSPRSTRNAACTFQSRTFTRRIHSLRAPPNHPSPSLRHCLYSSSPCRIQHRHRLVCLVPLRLLCAGPKVEEAPPNRSFVPPPQITFTAETSRLKDMSNPYFSDRATYAQHPYESHIPDSSTS